MSSPTKKPGKAPMPLPPVKPSRRTLELERKLEKARQRLTDAVNVYDDMDDLSELEASYSDSESDSIIVKDGKYANLDSNSEDDEEEEEDDSPDVSRSLSSDDEDSQERRRHRAVNKKRANESTASGFVVPSKQPRLSLSGDTVSAAAAEEMEAKKQRLEQLNNTIILNLRELERVNETILVNSAKAREELTLLQEKEETQIADELFALDNEKIRKELDERHSKENLFALENEKIRKELDQRRADLEQQEAKIAALHQEPKAVVPQVTALDKALSDMQKVHKNVLSKEQMSGIVPQNLLVNLAYLAGKQDLKYSSVVYGQYMILEVSVASTAETPQLLMRQIVSKDLYNAK